MNRPQLFARLILAGISLLVLTLALSFAGCRASKPPEATPPAVAVSPPPISVAPILAPTAKPAFFLSTPAGSARRQARKDARAAVPRKLGKGAVYAPKATEVVNAYKNTAPVINADSGATVTAIEKVKAPLAIGAGATATQTNPTTGLSWWWLLIPAAGLALWLYRKTFPFA